MPNGDDQLYIYLVSQDENFGYDTYDAMVVCAESVDQARNMHPNPKTLLEEKAYNELRRSKGLDDGGSCWAKDIKNIKVEPIGVNFYNNKIGVILTSYNAG